MIVHYDAKLIYLSHPRTGSVATEEGLRSIGFEFAPMAYRHAALPGNAWWQGLTNEERAQYVVFTTVRNPFDAVVAWWYNRDLGYPEITKEYVHALLQHDPAYMTDGRLWAIHGKHAHVVLKFENLQNDLSNFLEVYGLEVELPILNKTKRRHGRPYQDFYDDELRRYVEFRLEPDFKEFGYEWEEHAALMA